MTKVQRKKACLAFVTAVYSMAIQPAHCGYKPNPKDIYHKAWELVRDTYYDPSFNGQNWASLEHKFDAKILTVQDACGDIKLMLKSLNDPYTRYIDSETFKTEDLSRNGKIAGIGINLVQKEGKLVVTKTMDNGSAQKAGIQPKDEIVSIDGRTAIGFTPEQAAEVIKGKVGTVVQIAIRRGQTIQQFDIARAEIIIYSVSYHVDKNSPNIGVIQLSSLLSNSAAEEFENALNKLSRTDGLIIDLRDNAGGLDSNSEKIADMLLEGGVIGRSEGRNGKSVAKASGQPITHQPIVMLADDQTCGAAEVLIAAMKENRRAVFIGTRTFGDGLTQEINHLPSGGAIHISVSRLFTPNGADFNKVGIEPDILVSDHEQQDNEAIKYLKTHLSSVR